MKAKSWRSSSIGRTDGVLELEPARHAPPPFDVEEIELSGDLGFVRTRSHGTITPKGQKPEGGEGNREVFVLRRINGEWKLYRYIFNAEV